MTADHNAPPPDRDRPDQADWPADIDFRITGWDEQQAEPAADRPGLPLRWCAAAALLALLLALLGGGSYLYRSRTITTERTVSSGGAASLDLTGCPLGDTCSYLAESGAALLPTVTRYFPNSRRLQASTVYDSLAAAAYRTSLVVQTASNLNLSIVAQCVPQGAPVKAWQSSMPRLGPATITLLVPGSNGCSSAVTAQVPAGTAVPATALRRLAADPGLQLRP